MHVLSYSVKLIKCDLILSRVQIWLTITFRNSPWVPRSVGVMQAPGVKRKGAFSFRQTETITEIGIQFHLHSDLAILMIGIMMDL